MTDTVKVIKNEQWSVKQTMAKIHNKEITKPKYQRKKKWDILPHKNNVPNEKSYIEFLFNTGNSVHAITFGEETTAIGKYYTNIDGNNRINAIKHFMDKPFEIFNDYLTELNNYINTICLSNDVKILLKNIFYQLSYNDIINFKYNKYFNEHGYIDIYNNELKIFRDDIEVLIENIQDKLKLNGTDNFDINVKINVNLFEGYNTDELCRTFEEINKYNSKLTETELLACRLYNETHFDIMDNVYKTEIKECIKDYYTDKSDNEVLECYMFNQERDNINAHDFIVGFQNLCNKKYCFIGKTDVDGLSLFFKIYKCLYGGFINTFTDENVNDFIHQIIWCCEIFEEIIKTIFTEKINDKLFNNSCKKKIETLKKNNIYVIFAALIGYKNINAPKMDIMKNLERSILYHFFVADIKNIDKREAFKPYDAIVYEAGGSYIDNLSKRFLSKPQEINNKLSPELFQNVLNTLFDELNNPYQRKLDTGKYKNDKRRPLKFFEKTIMFYYYKEKIPTNMLDNEFSIEHIFPNSSEWDGQIDKDRTGNLIPIISGVNSSRGNKHINAYKTSTDPEFCNFIKDIIPSNEYDNVISHKEKKPYIFNNDLYNEICKTNENFYNNNLIKCLFN